MIETATVSAMKRRLSLSFAATLSLLLAAFGMALVFGRPALGRLLPGGLSLYIAIMVGLSLAAWALTWIYVTRIERIESGQGTGDGREPPR